MPQAIKSQKHALLDAGERLCRRTTPLSRVTTAVVATEAGLASIRFFDAYPDFNHYLIDLYQRHFLRPIRIQLESMIAQMPPGFERTRKLTQAYLDFCLKHRGLRRWTIDARSSLEFDAAYNRASQGFQNMAKVELQELGFSDDACAARLFAAMVYEISLIEVHDGHENTGMRQSMWRLLGAPDRPVLRFPDRRDDAPKRPQPAATATARQRLLHAGDEWFKERSDDNSDMQLESLLKRANVDQDSFDANFGDTQNFQLALVQSWTEQHMAVCLAATQGLPPGTERLHAFLAAAWDNNLYSQRGMRMLMKNLLKTDPELRARILDRLQGYTRMVALEFQMLGLPSSPALARLFVAASTELVEAEEQAQARLPKLREIFWQYFDPLTAGVQAGSRKGGRQGAAPEVAQTSFLTLQIGNVRKSKRGKRVSATDLDALRQRLVGAGDSLLLSGADIAALTPNRLALMAGIEHEEFIECYPEIKLYLTDLFSFLLDEVRDITVEATAQMHPGIPRMWRGIEVYLDARLDRPAIHKLSRQLQGYHPAAKLSRSRSRGFVRIFATEFESADWDDAEANGHLLTALVSETVQVEFEVGRRLPEYRDTLHSFLARA